MKKEHTKSKDVTIGYKSGLLTVTELVTINGQLKALCKCDCGKDSIKLRWELAIRFADNCGCLRAQKISNRLREHYSNYTGKKRPMPPLFGIYQGIIQRTTNPKIKNFNRYGGRGIKCEWKSYEEFYKDMGKSYKKGLTIDRINNDGNYSRRNCRWATNAEQSRNRSSNILVGDKCLIDYCKEHNLKFSTIQGRITTRGWSVEDAVNTPIGKGRTQFVPNNH